MPTSIFIGGGHSFLRLRNLYICHPTFSLPHSAHNSGCETKDCVVACCIFTKQCLALFMERHKGVAGPTPDHVGGGNQVLVPYFQPSYMRDWEAKPPLPTKEKKNAIAYMNSNCARPCQQSG